MDWQKRKMSLVLALACMPFHGLLAGTAAQQVRWEPGKIRIHRDEAFKGEMDSTKFDIKARGFSSALVEVLDRSCKIDRFVDDKGKSLLKEEGQKLIMMEGVGDFKIEEDRKTLSFCVSGKRRPTKGAKQVHAKGLLVLRCGRNKKTFSKPDLSMKKGTRLSLGGIQITLTYAGPYKFGLRSEFKDHHQVSFLFTGSAPGLDKLIFKNKDGKRIPAQVAQRSRANFGTPTRGLVYSFKEKIESCTVELLKWTEVKTIKVPFDIKQKIEE